MGTRGEERALFWEESGLPSQPEEGGDPAWERPAVRPASAGFSRLVLPAAAAARAAEGAGSGGGSGRCRGWDPRGSAGRTAIVVKKDSFTPAPPPPPSPSPEKGRRGSGQPQAEPSRTQRPAPTENLPAAPSWGWALSKEVRVALRVGTIYRIIFLQSELQRRQLSGLSPPQAPGSEEGRRGVKCITAGGLRVPVAGLCVQGLSSSFLHRRNQAARSRRDPGAAGSPGRLPGDLGTGCNHPTGRAGAIQSKGRSGFLPSLPQGI